VPSWFPAATRSIPVAGQVTFRSAWASLAKWQKNWILCWWGCLVIPALAALVVFGGQQRANSLLAAQRHADRMNPLKNDAVSTQIDLTRPAGHESDVPTEVKVGVYVTRIPSFSVIQSTWNVDFFVWFAWEGDDDLTPGESFQVVSGEILTRVQLRKTNEADPGHADKTKHYVLYRVTALVTKEFDVSRFPRDEHLLTLTLEDQGSQIYRLAYVADPTSEMSSRVFVSGYTVGKREIVAKPHTYKTALGDPSSALGAKATYSDFVFGIPLTRSSWGLFFKMFAPTYLSILVAIAGLLAHGVSERIGLASTALFVQVMNAMTVATLIPDTGVATLADVINGLSYFLIGLLVFQAILYHRFFADREGVASAVLVFDRSTFAITSVLTLVLNVGVLWAASPH
jgi:hypothetical protein